MGLYEREYYRDEAQGIQLGGGWSVVTTLMVINGAIFILDMLFGGVMDLLALRADIVQHPLHFYTLFTYGFAHSSIDQPGGIFHILFNMFALFVFGRPLEMRLGRFEFLRVYLLAIPICGLVWVASTLLRNQGVVPASVVGASGAVTAVIILYCLYNPNATIILFFFPVPAWIGGTLIVLMDLLGSMNRTENVAYEAHLAGAAFGAAYFYFGWNLQRVLPDRLFRWSEWTKRRPKLRVHRPEADGESEWMDIEDTDDPRDEEADEILKKLHRQGEDSLTSRERKILEDYSRRMRQKHR